MKSANMKMLHAVDPAEELKLAVGDISKIKVFHNNILCAVYKRPEKLASGLYISDKTRQEDEYQGKVVLVLKKGPLAFIDDDKTAFAGQDVNPGDWVVLRSSDGWKLNINGVLCHVIQDVQIKMTVPEPDVAF
jgi:co-chaperonin GroES (HSP10)